MMTPRVYVDQSPYPEQGANHCGFGLHVESYRGDRMVGHSGSWVGCSTMMLLLPDHGIGVAVLTNRSPSPVQTLLSFAVFDRLREREPVNWFERMHAGRQKDLARETNNRQSKAALRGKGLTPSHPLADYVGDYEHPAYGLITINLAAAGVLAWHWRGLSSSLMHCHYDAFETPEKPTELFPDELRLTFLYNEEGIIDRLTAPFEPTVAPIEFRRVQASGDR